MFPPLIIKFPAAAKEALALVVFPTVATLTVPPLILKVLPAADTCSLALTFNVPPCIMRLPVEEALNRSDAVVPALYVPFVICIRPPNKTEAEAWAVTTALGLFNQKPDVLPMIYVEVRKN